MQNITPVDIQRILSVAALADRPVFAGRLRTFLQAAQAVSTSAGVEAASFDARFALGAPRVEAFDFHLCRSSQCGLDHLVINWPETPLAPSQIKRVLGGFHVVGEMPADEEPVATTVLSAEASRHLSELVEVTQALPSHDEIKALVASVHAVLETVEVPYLGFYLRVRPAANLACEINRVVFHWCLGQDCEEPAARGYAAVDHPGAIHVCGYTGDRLPRFGAPFVVNPF